MYPKNLAPDMTQIMHLDSPVSYHMFCIQFAKINHFRLFGKGRYAKVYSSKKSLYAYKIGLITAGQKDPYLTYLRKAGKEKSDFFPKVRTITVFTYQDNKEKFYVVEMEKLEKFNEKKSLPVLGDLYRVMDCHVNHNRFGSSIHLVASKFIPEIKGIKTVFDILQKLGEEFNPDWHADNMMMRKDGQLVFTDPVH